MKVLFFYGVTTYLILWIQALNHHLLGPLRVAPDLVLLAVLYGGLFRRPFTGPLTGFVWGLLVDAASQSRLGFHSFLYGIAGYGAAMLSRQLDESKIGAQVLFSGGVSILIMVLYQGLLRLVTPGTGTPLGWALLQALINALCAPVVFWILQRWYLLWDLHVRER